MAKGNPKDNYLRHVAPGEVKVIKKSSYHYYMKSDAWKKKAKQVRQKSKHKCAACGKYAYQVHHNNYSNIFKERSDDLVLLCGRCHFSFHEVYGTAKDMKAATKQFIEEMKQYKNTLHEGDRLDYTFRNMFR